MDMLESMQQCYYQMSPQTNTEYAQYQ